MTDTVTAIWQKREGQGPEPLFLSKFNMSLEPGQPFEMSAQLFERMAPEYPQLQRVETPPPIPEE